MARVLALRVLGTIVLLFVLSILIFLMLYLAPGDLVTNLVGVKNVTPELTEQIREQYGLNDPLYLQYLHWLGNLLTGNLGISIRNQTVSELSFKDAEDAMDFVATDLMRDRGDDLYEPEEE